MAWVVWAVLSACEPVPPSSLDDVVVPAGFTIESARDATLTVRLDPDLVARAPHVVVALPDGRVLSDGTLDADTTYTLRLPPGQDTVRVTADVGGPPVADVDVRLAPGRPADVTLGGDR